MSSRFSSTEAYSGTVLTQTITKTFTYDHAGRLEKVEQQISGDTTNGNVVLAQNDYNELGQLMLKKLHSASETSYAQDIDYLYDVRGWLTRINDPITIGGNKLFAMELFYDTDMSAALSGGPQFNGNINGIKWRNYNNGLLTWKGYNFTYDGLNRLKQGDYGTYTTGWNNTNTYDLSGVTYDLNGNISTMNCKNPAGTDKENLAYSYTGNQLSSVTGTYNSVTNKTGSFTYDANGNAISDGLRGLASVSYYDEIDLPKQYFKDANNKVDYQYDARGNKWGKTATISGTPSTMNYYGQFIYQGNTLSKVLTPEGFFDPVTYMYHYHLKDHLGNTRITFCYSGSTPIVDQEVEYYPFGALFAQNNLDKNTYLYNGKELNNEFFENYDYGARFYDPVIGRWHSPDPKAEIYPDISPYTYVLNNPLRLIDPNGEDVYLVIWASDNGHIGHAGIATDNYRTEEVKDKNGRTVLDKNGNVVTKQVKDGTVTYRDLWPGGEGANKSNATQDIPGAYSNPRVTTLDALQNSDVSGSEGYAPSAVVQMTTDSKTDALVNMALDAHQSANSSYNGRSNNCSDFAKAGVEYASPVGSPLGNTDERIGSSNATTPNQLYKATVNLPNAKVLKDPGNKVNNKFLDAVAGGSGTRRKIAERKMR